MASGLKCNVMKHTSETWSSKMPEGLALEISHHPLTMKRVANLIIAMERLKGGWSESLLSSEFRDENLLSIMLESAVEEHLVVEVTSAPPEQGVFTRREEQQYSVYDSQKRSLVRDQNNMELHAVVVQGGNEDNDHIVTLNMSTYLQPVPSTQSQPVALGIKGTNFYLSCSKDGDKPTLHLEAMDKDNLRSISKDSEMARFLFYKQITGVDVSTLHSACFPQWYISTAESDNMPVDMCQQTCETRYKNFTIRRIANTQS
ncbi:interleukin-1 beta-like [Centroberyx affinis]|uniref:interleukin-1 beta-like n=1 Tax=Centroberyx affinis TaxID=166261 RepID=UPI003A5C4DF5